MIRAYDDNGNVVDLVSWENKIRVDTIDEMFMKIINAYYEDVLDEPMLNQIARESKEKKNE